jgi:hypothetical protein
MSTSNKLKKLVISNISQCNESITVTNSENPLCSTQNPTDIYHFLAHSNDQDTFYCADIHTFVVSLYA